MKVLQIVSRHNSLTEAVKASGMDLSYNELVALKEIHTLENPLPRWQAQGNKPVTEAFVILEDGVKEVYYTFECDIRILNKFEPFHACLHDGAFSIAMMVGDELRISGPFSKDRKLIRKFQMELSDKLWAVK